MTKSKSNEPRPARPNWDGAYKLLFSHKAIFHRFLTRFVESEFLGTITPDDLTLISNSFVSDQHQRREADIIYQITLNQPQKEQAGGKKARKVYVYIFTEFQSTVDKSIPIRLWRYIGMFYDQCYRNSQKGKLPGVFPIVLYTGKARWTIPTNIKDMIEETVPLDYRLSFPYHLIVEHDIPNEQLERRGGAYAAVVLANQLHDERALRQSANRFIDLLQEEDTEAFNMVRDYIQNIFGYMLDDETKGKITNRNPKGENTMLTDVADQIYSRGIEEGEQKGWLEGKQEGSRETTLDTAHRMLGKKLSIDLIHDVTGLSKDAIAALRQQG